MKTIKDWLNDLPEGIRERAIKNYEAEKSRYYLSCRATKYPSLASAISCAFSWERSLEGDEYWQDVHDGVPPGSSTESPDTPSESKIEALEKEIAQLHSELDLCHSVREQWKAQVEELKLALADKTEAWVNTNDRFPDKEGKYLCCLTKTMRVLNFGFYRYRVTGELCPVIEGQTGAFTDSNGYGNKVNYWMPLPELPQEYASKLQP